MKFKHVMVPYDGSDHAKSALAYAKELAAECPEMKISVVHAISAGIVGADQMGTAGALDGVPYGMMDYAQYQEIVQSAISKATENVKKDLAGDIAGMGDRCEVVAVAGASPADTITHYAEKNDVDLIVMGRRGLGAIRGMLGSVSFGVLRSTEIPVLTVK